MRRLMLVLIAGAITACSSDSSTEPAKISVVGTFQLKTVNGSALPFTLTQSGTSKQEIIADQVTINADGTYSELTSTRTTVGTAITTSQSGVIGVYQATNGQIAFTQTSPTTGNYSGSVSGNTLTLIVSGFSLVYGR